MKKNLLLLSSLVAMLIAPALTGCSSGDDFKVDYLPAKESSKDKWGFVNSKGEMIFADEFENCPSLVMNGVFGVEEGKDGLYTLYTVGSKSPEAIPEAEGLKDIGMFTNGVIPVVRPNERIKFLNKSGQVKVELMPISGHEITMCGGYFNEDKLWIQIDNGKYGFINASGDVVIEPKFDGILSSFVGGNAVVRVDKESGSVVEVIDKKGEVVFKLKDSQSFRFITEDYVVVDKDDRVQLLDRKGEVKVKCPAKVKSVYSIYDDLLVYKNDDGDMGVMTLEGETVIRDKYDEIVGYDGKFFCAKENDKGVDVVNKKGDVEKTLDYKRVIYAAGFGLVGLDGDDFVILSNKGEQEGKIEFESLNFPLNYAVASDYFNADEIAEKAVKAFDGAVFSNEGVKMGVRPTDIPNLKSAGANAFRYTSQWSYTVDSTRTWQSNAVVYFSENISKPIYQEETYGYYYVYTYQKYVGEEFNNDAKVEAYGERIYMDRDEAPTVAKKIISLLKENGAKEESSKDGITLLSAKDKYYMVYIDSDRTLRVLVTADNSGMLNAARRAQGIAVDEPVLVDTVAVDDGYGDPDLDAVEVLVDE